MSALRHTAILLGLLVAVVLPACGDDESPTKTNSDAAIQEDPDASKPDASKPDDPEPTDDDPNTLPIVFVHGFAGSASQFDSQAQRFVANGFPADRLYAYDHDGESLDFGGFVTGLDKIVEEALAKWKVSQI